MGYRIRLGKIAKIERDKYKGKTYDEVDSMIQAIESEDSPYYPPEYTELHEIGKYVNFNDNLEGFYDFDIYEACESEFHIMTKENLKFIIESYHKDTHDYYIKLEKDPSLHTGFFKKKRMIWDPEISLGCVPYYLDQEKTDGEIVQSWSKEYAIFNLVYIYRTFEWEKDYLIYSGW